MHLHTFKGHYCWTLKLLLKLTEFLRSEKEILKFVLFTSKWILFRNPNAEQI